MKSVILDYLSNTSSTLGVREIITSFSVATFIAIIIYISYKITHSRAIYSAKFNVSLIMLTMITTLVMCVIGNNIALSLGMVGALSIVRFRTAIKDQRDSVYIFWCIAAGICCGVSEYLIVGIGTLVIFLALMFLGSIHSDERYLLVIRGDREKESETIQMVKSMFYGKAALKVNQSDRKVYELIFEISKRHFDKNSKKESIVDHLYETGHIQTVNIICQTDELSR